MFWGDQAQEIDGQGLEAAWQSKIIKAARIFERYLDHNLVDLLIL